MTAAASLPEFLSVRDAPAAGLGPLQFVEQFPGRAIPQLEQPVDALHRGPVHARPTRSAFTQPLVCPSQSFEHGQAEIQPVLKVRDAGTRATGRRIQG